MAAGLEPRLRRFHHANPATRTGTSHQPKTRIEITAVASVCNTRREAFHACAATSAGLQASRDGHSFGKDLIGQNWELKL
jgi:hypothetical protein